MLGFVDKLYVCTEIPTDQFILNFAEFFSHDSSGSQAAEQSTRTSYIIACRTARVCFVPKMVEEESESVATNQKNELIYGVAWRLGCCSYHSRIFASPGGLKLTSS